MPRRASTDCCRCCSSPRETPRWRPFFGRRTTRRPTIPATRANATGCNASPFASFRRGRQGRRRNDADRRRGRRRRGERHDGRRLGGRHRRRWRRRRSWRCLCGEDAEGGDRNGRGHLGRPAGGPSAWVALRATACGSGVDRDRTAQRSGHELGDERNPRRTADQQHRAQVARHDARAVERWALPPFARATG